MAAPLIRVKNNPGIYERGSRYVVVWQHRGKQHKRSFRTLTEARAFQGETRSGRARPVSRVTFADYFAEWIESYAGRTSRGFSETTRPEYRRPIEAHALPRWGSWRLAEVEAGDVRDLFGTMRKAGATTSAIKKLRAALSALFATAVEDGLRPANPVSGVRIPPAPQGDELENPEDRGKALTRTELALLLDAIPEDRRLFFEFLAATGLRISEAVGLTWAHIDLGTRPRVLVREQVYRGKRRRLKSRNARREIPLDERMARQLAEHRRDTYRNEADPVFASAKGTPLNPSRLSRTVLKPAARSVGLGWVSAHSFRHTCASMLFERGSNVKQVAVWLGHADAAFTLRTYVHLMDEGVGAGLDLDLDLGARTVGG